MTISRYRKYRDKKTHLVGKGLFCQDALFKNKTKHPAATLFMSKQLKFPLRLPVPHHWEGVVTGTGKMIQGGKRSTKDRSMPNERK